MSVTMEREKVIGGADAELPAVLSAVGLTPTDLAVSLLDQSKDCIKILSVDGTLDFMNCGGLGAMEIDDPSMVLGKIWWSLWPTHSQSLVEEQFKTALGGRPVVFEAFCPTAKGQPRFWSVDLKPMFARDGRVVSVLATSREIAVF